MRLLSKLKLSPWLLRLASYVVDYEAESLPPDGRIVEYGFVLGKLIALPEGRVLDIGCVARHNYVVPALCFAGWDVWGIDLRAWGFEHTNFRLIQGDILKSGLENEQFEYVICISTLEHTGLAGRYGVTEQDNEGDVKTAKEIARIMKPNGRLFLTVPYSKNYFVRHGARIYDMGRLKDIFGGFTIKDKAVYAQVDGSWIAVASDIGREGIICLELIKE